MSFTVQTFYTFKPLNEEELESIRAWLILKANTMNVFGLVILSTEGINTTLACRSDKSLEDFVGAASRFLYFDKLSIKKSESDIAPFRKFSVKLRREIVTLKKPEFVPHGPRRHLSPDQWHKKLAEQDVVVVDTRNDYEIEIGTFEKAIDLDIKEFSDFPEKIKDLQTDKEKPHLIFCTGGIRCEKAMFEMEAQGFKKVYQLDGGILNYMEKYPEGHFNGECFVFDSRVALNKDLRPSENFTLCPQCGEVGSQPIQCRKCGEDSKICKACLKLVEENPEYETCSKNCRYHYSRDPNKKGPQQKQFYHYK